MNYINISTHKFVGRNNQQLTKKLSLDFELTNVIQFQFINSNNQILDIDSSNLYLAGAIIPDYSNSKVIFYSNNYTYDSETKTLTFTIDTFTENYAKYIKRPDQISFLEIGKNARENILCFDTIVCQPRIYTPETPSPEHLDEYYTMEEADARFATLSAFEADVANLSANYWTKYETAQAIANVQTMEIVVLQELPPIEDAQEYTIYLIPSTDQEVGNVYDEYLVINHNYEKIGSTAIDLSQYYTKDEADANFLPLSGGTVTGNLIATKYFGGGNFTIDGGAVHLGPYSTGTFSHLAIGQSHILNGWYDVAIGKRVVDLSPAAGYTFSYGNDLIVNESYQLLLGQYNIKTIGARVTGGGLSSSDRKNIEVLDWDGNLTLAGGLSASGITVNGTDINSLYFPLTGGTVNGNVNVNGNLKISNFHGLAFQNSSSFNNSIAIGYNAKTEGPYSIALGYSALARNEGELCIGYTPTSGHVGYSLIICKGAEDRTSIGLRYTNGTLEVNDNIIASGSLTASGAIFTGHVSLNGHQENTPGGFVVQDLSGKITANYLEATSGISINGEQCATTDFVSTSISNHDNNIAAHPSGFNHNLVINTGGTPSLILRHTQSDTTVPDFHIHSAGGWTYFLMAPKGTTSWLTTEGLRISTETGYIYAKNATLPTPTITSPTISGLAISIHNNVALSRDYDITETPSSNIDDYYFIVKDTNSKNVGRIMTSRNADGSIVMKFGLFNNLRNSNNFVSIGAGVDVNGNAVTSAPTPPAGDNSTKIATTAFVQKAIADALAARGL